MYTELRGDVTFLECLWRGAWTPVRSAESVAAGCPRRRAHQSIQERWTFTLANSVYRRPYPSHLSASINLDRPVEAAKSNVISGFERQKISRRRCRLAHPRTPLKFHPRPHDAELHRPLRRSSGTDAQTRAEIFVICLLLSAILSHHAGSLRHYVQRASAWYQLAQTFQNFSPPNTALAWSFQAATQLD